MSKDTKTKYKKPQNRIQSLENRGFIRLFILIIILVAILIYFGLDPKGIWDGLLKPIIEWGFNLFVKIIGFLFDIAIWFVQKLAHIIGM